MKHLLTICISVAVIAAVSCKQSHTDSGTAVPHAIAGENKSGDAIALPHYQPTLPPAPGRDAFAVGCLSCHTTGYITTQPPLTAAKWEESVRKMMKTYSAPIAEDQVQPIVQYLMVAKENGPPGAWETPVPVPAQMPADLDLLAGDATLGKQLYASQCASCHGQAGNANTPAAATMLPRATDLTSGHWAPKQVARAIIQGVPGTAMPGYPNLDARGVAALVAYAAQFEPPEQPAPPPNDLADAKALYVKNCVSCHGSTGAGDGFAAPPLARPPANFQARRPTLDHATLVVTEGVGGTAMPAWKSKLTDPQRAALAQYIRTLYQD